MPDGGSENASPFIIPIALVLIGAILHQQEILTGSRPKNTDKIKKAYTKPQDVDARLWEDPFAAITRHREIKKKNAPKKITLPVYKVHASENSIDISGDAEHETHPHHLILAIPSKQESESCVNGNIHKVECLKYQIESNISKLENGNNLVVLGVMVSGSPYYEDAERRRKRRYAIWSGLATEGFHPKDSEHIAHFSCQL